MRSNSLVVRLFSVITLIFVVFVSIAFSLQIKSFESYYFDRKIRDIDEQYLDFAEIYDASDWNQSELEQYVRYYENQNDIKMGIIDNYYSIVNEKKYKIYILNSMGRVYDVLLNNIFSDADYQNIALHVGDDIEVQGYLWGDSLKSITLMRMTINGEVVFDKVDPKLKARLDLDTVSGSVMRTDLPDDEDLIFGTDYTGLAAIVDQYYFNREELNMADNSFIYTERSSGKKFIVKVFPSTRKGIKSIFIMTRQQPIIEATEALRAFYPALITGVLVIGTFMLFFLSKVIANPLAEIEQKAKKMADFDFSEYIEVKGTDEIGNLSRSLNQLSYNLECTIKELNDANEKLMDDIERERKLENMRKEFIRNISHELKTPLGVIRAFTEGLQDGVVENDVDYYSNIILEEVENLEVLVSDMLELSKLQTGAYATNRESFRFNALIENILEKNRSFAGDKGMTIQFEPCRFDEVYGDYRKMSRVVLNFLSNAIRYGYPDTDIKIKTIVLDRKLRFEIYNACDPIPEKQLHKLWDKFYRIDESRSKSYGGSGLGLAIVKEILEHHQCDYGVANTENGVIFYFELDKYNNMIV